MIIKIVRSYLWLLAGVVLTGSLLIANQVEATSTIANKGKVDFEVVDGETVPIDPENPKETIDIEGPILSTKGPLRFDYIPFLSFGNQFITDKDQEYYVDPIKLENSDDGRANFFQVTDNRGSATGWRVTVRQEQEFLSKKSKQPLKGAYLSFDNQWSSSETEELGLPVLSKETIKLTDIGASYPVATAELGTGTGTWAVSFGSAHEHTKMKNTLIDRSSSEKELNGSQTAKKNTSIRLFVPGNTKKKQETYSTILTWTLSEI